MENWKATERSYSAPDRYVCSSCVTDKYLAKVLDDAASDEPCSYCGNASAAYIDFLCDEIAEAIATYYVDPADKLPYCSAEGGFQGMVVWGSEVVYGEFDPWTDCDELLDDVAHAFSADDWTERSGSGQSRYELLLYSWSHFSEQVRHRTRYLFLRDECGDEEYSDKIPLKEMLTALGKLFQDFDLFCELSPETAIYRARTFKAGECRPAKVEDLGTAPRSKAIFPNRMSPAGISMFYGALDEKTAVLEIYNRRADRRRNKEIALACFRNTRPLTLLNLTNLPEVPSIFDPDMRYEYPLLGFLNAFERDFTKPVTKRKAGHTDYVPTQIVTEFVRDILRTSEGQGLDGILYTSSRDIGGKALVVFAGPEHCGPRDRVHFDPEPYLVLENPVQYITNDKLRLLSQPRSRHQRRKEEELDAASPRPTKQSRDD